MKGIWYGDRRDRVKWGGLIHLARLFRISELVYISYLRESVLPSLNVNGESVQIPEEVWAHFSNLRNVDQLAAAAHIRISAIGSTFEHTRRGDYNGEIVKKLRATRGPLIAFCDPDTGIAIGKPHAEHVTVEDLKAIWATLGKGDILAVYQHAQRQKTWIEDQRELLALAISADVNTITAPDIARDVALLWCKK